MEGTTEMFKSLAGAAIALLVNLPSVAQADTHLTSKTGAWETYDGTGSDNNIPLCVAKLSGQDRAFMVKYQGDMIFLQISKNGWNIPNNTPVDVNIEIDNAPGYTLHAVGYTENMPNGPFSAVQFDFGWDQVNPASGETYVKEFTNLLTAGLTLKISFPNGNEPGWSGSLKGSAASFGVFIDCASKIYQANHPAVTQPFTPSTTPPVATQPFRKL
jgi:hypothetical protein